MKLEYIIIIACASAIALLLIGYFIGTVVKKKKIESGKNKASEIKVKDGVRYTKDEAVLTDGGEVNITHNEGDKTLERGKEYTVAKNGYIMPGKYSMLSASGEYETFNMRIGGYVREYSHFTDIVLKEGDKICAVSHTVVLR